MKKWYGKAALLILIVSVVVFILPLWVGIWVPDIVNGSRNVLAEERKGSESVRVIQYWNHIDFYSTEVEYFGTNGFLTRCTVDADDSKSWRVALIVDWERKKANVTLGGGRLRTVDLLAGEWQR